MMEASGCPRVSIKCQDCFLVMIQQRSHVTTSSELGQQSQLADLDEFACTERKILLGGDLEQKKKPVLSMETSRQSMLQKIPTKIKNLQEIHKKWTTQDQFTVTEAAFQLFW